VLLRLTQKEGRRSSWSGKPLVYPAQRQKPSTQTSEAKAPLLVPVPRNPGTRAEQDVPPEDGAIESERQLHAALTWIDYWKAYLAEGAQSWLAEEQARHEIMQWQYRIDDYRRRQAREQEATQAEDGVRVA
jgi:hypothetical protein